MISIDYRVMYLYILPTVFSFVGALILRNFRTRLIWKDATWVAFFPVLNWFPAIIVLFGLLGFIGDSDE